MFNYELGTARRHEFKIQKLALRIKENGFFR